MPDRVDEIADQAFASKKFEDDDYSLSKQILTQYSEAKFFSPENWTGPKHITETKVLIDF